MVSSRALEGGARRGGGPDLGKAGHEGDVLDDGRMRCPLDRSPQRAPLHKACNAEATRTGQGIG